MTNRVCFDIIGTIGFALWLWAIATLAMEYYAISALLGIAALPIILAALYLHVITEYNIIPVSRDEGE